MIQLGILGLPNSGKTTLFNTICQANQPITPYPGGEIALHSAVARLQDSRLLALQEMYQAAKIVPIAITFVDVNGMGTSSGEGMPPALRNPLAELDGFLYTLRHFHNSRAPHPLSSVDAARDFALIEGEFLLADQLTVERRLARIQEEIGLKGPRRGDELAPEYQILERLWPSLDAGQPLRCSHFSGQEASLLNGFNLLSLKPVLALVNLGEEALANPPNFQEISQSAASQINLTGALEWELAQLPEDERALFMTEYGLSQLVAPGMRAQALSLLERITFYTVNDREARAWSLRRGSTALMAAAQIHSDLARGFIRAEVMSSDELLAAAGEKTLRQRGRLRLEGRDYIVQDGDVLMIRFNV